MKKRSPHTLQLTEYQTSQLPPAALPTAVGEKIWRTFDQNGKRIQVEFPTPKTDDNWQLTPQGWVGHAPVTPEFSLHIQPRIPIQNLFGMWAYAYALRSWEWLPDLTAVHTLPQFFETLAHLLAQRTLHRARQGLHRDYLPRRRALPFVKGRLSLRETWQRPVQTWPVCRYAEHTADIVDNQILAYTLMRIGQSRRCRPPVQTAVRRAYHLLQNVTTPRPFQPQECQDRHYTRLNQDYQPLHALCRFFLEHLGPGQQAGDYEMMPFLVNMARLYELFVAEWLQAHLPSPWRLQAQETVTVGPAQELRFEIDLVLYDGDGRPYAVLDTKYKTPQRPDHADVNQIVTYAKAKECPQAILIYPAQLPQPFDVQFGRLRLRSLTFALDHDLNEAGQQFLQTLLLRQEY